MIHDFGTIEACPKCGSHDLIRVYMKNAHDYGCSLGFQSSDVCCKYEHHERTCRGCGFKFAERVMEEQR